MNWKHQQRMESDSEDQQFLGEEGEEERQELGESEEDIDPLDAFMNDLQKNKGSSNKIEEDPELPPEDNEDDPEGEPIGDLEGQPIRVESEPEQILSNEEGGEEVEKKKEKKIIEALKPFDFSRVQLEDFQKNFYQEHPEITNLTDLEIKKYLKEMEIKVTGADVPKPIVSFGHLQLEDILARQIAKQQFEKPTPIQAISLPTALSGRDIVGIAKTGSGKTLAYVLPLIVHVADRPPARKGEGPSAIVLGPTRQLCQQIYLQTRKYAKKYDFRVSCLLGGQNKHDQWKTLKAGVDVLIASPGRLIEMIRKKATSLVRVTYLVLDEADRMLSLGFQQQIRSIVNQTREDRQTLLFTATMKRQMQFLVNDIISSPIRINVGEEGAANEDVKQDVVIVDQEEGKMNWLMLHFHELVKEGKVLVFTNHRGTCEDIGRFLQEKMGISAMVLHGDKSQYERTVIMNSFKADSKVLVATDIAARGIDVKNIKTVINYQCPKQIEAYIHRIGRAGRAGQTGKSYAFLTKSDVKFAILLVKTFQNSGYPVPEQLEDLACLDDFFKRKRLSAKMGVSFAKGKDASKFLTQIIKKQRVGFSRAGLGYEEPKGNPGQRNRRPQSISHEAPGFVKATRQL